VAKALLKENGEVRQFRDYLVKQQDIERIGLSEFNHMNQNKATKGQ